MYTTKKSIIGMQLMFLLVLVSFAYIAQGQEEISPQDRFKLMQEKAEAQRAEFEERQNTQRETFEENQSQQQERFQEQKEALTEQGEMLRTQATERGEGLSEEKKEALRQKVEAREGELRERVAERTAALEGRQQERIANLAANVSNKMEAVIARLRQIIERFQTRMDSLADTGSDISAAQEALNESSAHLDDAQALIAGIDGLIAEVVASESPREAWTTAKGTYTEVKDHIKLAHTSLRTALQLLKDAVAEPAETIEENTSEEVADPADQEAPTS